MSIRVYDTLAPMRRVIDSMEISYNSLPLDKADTQLMRDCLLLWGAMSMDLLGKTGMNNYHWVLTRTPHLDCLAFGQAIKDAISAVRHITEFLDESHECSYAAFTQQLRTEYKELLFLPVKPHLLQYFKTTDPGDFYIILQWVSFLSKVELRSVDRSSEIDDYVLFEEELSTWSYEESEVKPLRDIITEWFSSYHIGDPKISSGAKSEIPRRNVTLPTCLAHLHYVPEHPEWAAYNSRPCNREARVEIVPKSMVTGRTVCPDSVTMGYYQQATSAGMLDSASKDFRSLVNLHDQSRSRELARVGSIDGSYGTIDLSAASDSVTTDLVCRIFSGVPSLLRDLLGSRSLTAKLPTGQSIRLRKFAPMGSATCFPVECVVFASVCEASRRACSSPRRSVVYGDDLVVPCEYVDDVVQRLQSLNFTVNLHKSYFGQVRPVFREACGGQYVDGKDVTPLMISRKLTNHLQVLNKPESFEAWVSLVSRAHKYMLTNLRSLALYLLNDALGWRSKLIDRRSFSYQVGLVVKNRDEHIASCNTFSVAKAFCATNRPQLLETNEELCYLSWFLASERNQSLGSFFPMEVRPEPNGFSRGFRPQRKLGVKWIRI